MLVRVVTETDPWGFGWSAVAGIATVILALFTAWLAKSTRDLARETDQDVRAAWRPILATEEPRITVREDLPNDRYVVQLQLLVVNTGRGPALNCEVSGRRPRSVTGINWTPQKVNTIPVDGNRPVELEGDISILHAPNWTSRQRYSFALSYEDVARNLHRTTVVFDGAELTRSRTGPGLDAALSINDIEIETLTEKTPRRGWPR
jgi:hypothetical protein